MLHTCVASTDRDLTTTGRVRAVVLGATATSTAQDALISDLIRAASRWAETYVGYPLTLQSYEEMRPGYGRRRLMLSRTPLVAVDRVFEATDTGTATQVLTSEFRVEDREAGFLSRDRGWPWTPMFAGRTNEGFAPIGLDPVGDEYRPWLVDYRAGWTLGGVSTSSPNWSTEHGTTSTGRTLPEDIEEAVVRKAVAMLENTDDVVEEKLGDLSVTYRSERIDDPAPSSPEFLLGPYRRLV